MQLLIPAWDTYFWHWCLHMWHVSLIVKFILYCNTIETISTYICYELQQITLIHNQRMEIRIWLVPQNRHFCWRKIHFVVLQWGGFIIQIESYASQNMFSWCLLITCFRYWCSIHKFILIFDCNSFDGDVLNLFSVAFGSTLVQLLACRMLNA